MNVRHSPSFDAEITLDELIINAQSHAQASLQLIPRVNRRIKKPVFVVGCPRSGTTVLGRCLGAHPQCATAEESLILLPLWRIYVDLYLGNIPSGVSHLSEYVSAETLTEALGDLTDTTFSSLLHRHNAQMYVDHTPWYGVIAPFVKALYPDARFVHIIRDGRQVTRSLQDSYKKGFRWAGANLSIQSAVWTDMINQTSQMLNNYSDDTITVHYKELSQSAESTIRSITDFLDITFESSMLEPLQTKHASTKKDNVFGIQVLEQRFTPSGWPKDWNKEECNLFSKRAGETMNFYFKADWRVNPQ